MYIHTHIHVYVLMRVQIYTCMCIYIHICLHKMSHNDIVHYIIVRGIIAYYNMSALAIVIWCRLGSTPCALWSPVNVKSDLDFDLTINYVYTFRGLPNMYTTCVELWYPMVRSSGTLYITTRCLHNSLALYMLFMMHLCPRAAVLHFSKALYHVHIQVLLF